MLTDTVTIIAQLPLVDAAPITTTPLSHFCPTCGENFTAKWRMEDHDIIAHVLTATPLLVDEWGEWAALTLDGNYVTGTARRTCLELKRAADVVWARAQAVTP